MKTFWLQTYNSNSTVGDRAAGAQFGSIEKMLSVNGALCYSARKQASEAKMAIDRVSRLEVGQETKTQSGFHPRHGAELSVVRRVS
jgi:hypothetical protein